MTDDSNARYRNDPFASPPEQGAHGSDPLAELARLIGQGNTFADAGRDSRTASREPYYGADATASDPHQAPEPQYTDHASYERSYDEPRLDRESESRFDEPTHSPYDQPPEPRYGEPSEPRYERSFTEGPALPTDWNTPAHDAVPPYDTRHAAQHSAPDVHSSFRSEPADEPNFAPFPAASGSRPMPPPHADEFYDDAPQGGHRKGVITVAAVLCLAVFGTAAAFGYRTMFSGSAAKSPPPVIKASGEPTKVAPPPAADNSNASKISYDRFGDRSQNEQVVVREEKPVDVKDAVRTGAASRPPGVNVTTTSAFPAPPAATGNPPSVLTEPKRVRTVPIRPESPDTSAARPQMIASAPAAAKPAPAASANAPLDLANPPPPAAVRAPSRPVTSAPQVNTPLSLAPDANLAPATAQARAAPPPARVASAPAGNGSYLVQVSSQRSEADAQAAFRSIQSKYSSVLGDRQVTIRRADLAGKGTYYRAMVGPFGTRDQAIQLCSSLKSAGGDCVVQAN